MLVTKPKIEKNPNKVEERRRLKSAVRDVAANKINRILSLFKSELSLFTMLRFWVYSDEFFVFSTKARIKATNPIDMLIKDKELMTTLSTTVRMFELDKISVKKSIIYMSSSGLYLE